MTLKDLPRSVAAFNQQAPPRPSPREPSPISAQVVIHPRPRRPGDGTICRRRVSDEWPR